ncbi:unnamed protein product [Darwinula stevensoni]|uniref:Uncharacterized protein n=1 Tax=Darwinula stevensoni TaxID=69355 RepID=A0A7R9ABN7_9CRUS|nr:unnamed protein product [Darwinula stevensoni]CAG0899548.1 unnamed protein product [Darwinula stevensoni]
MKAICQEYLFIVEGRVELPASSRSNEENPTLIRGGCRRPSLPFGSREGEEKDLRRRIGKFWFFNVTNADEFLLGNPLELAEVGPYVFR